MFLVGASVLAALFGLIPERAAFTRSLRRQLRSRSLLTALQKGLATKRPISRVPASLKAFPGA